MKRYSLILLVFFAVSCTQSARKKASPSACLAEGVADRALFEVDEVEGSFNKLADSSESILPSKFLLKFKACIKDSLKKQPMRNHSLGIHTFRDKRKSEKTIKSTLCENVEWGCTPVDTDNNGCFKWEEVYNFALPAEQRWVEFKRVITHRTGTRLIRMMINPWIPGTKIVDLRYGEMENYLGKKPIFRLHEASRLTESGESEIDKCKEEGSLDQAFNYLDEKEEKAFLWVDQVEFSPSLKVPPDSPDYKEIYKICDDSLSSEECDKSSNYDKEGSFLHFKLKIPVYTISDDESGRLDYKRVPAGSEFDVTFYLLSEIGRHSSSGNGKKYYMLHRRLVEPVIATAGSEYIYLDNALLHIPYKTIEGTSVILLKVKSLGEADMEPFYGVYEIKDKSIGNFHGWSDSLSLKSSESAPDENLDLDQASVSNVESQKQRIQEYKEMFEKFHAEDAYALHTPKSIEGFDHFKGLALDLKRMRFARIKASGDTCSSPVKRWVVYLGEVCLKDPSIDNEPLQKRRVTVTALDMRIGRNSEGRITVELDPEQNAEEIVNNRPADENGCIQFTYELDHKLYDIQKYFMKKLTFKANDLEESKYIALNPWEYGFLTYQEFTQAYESWDDAQEKYKECKKDSNCSRAEQLGGVLQKAESDLEKAESDLEGPLFSENLPAPKLRLNEYRSVIIEPSYKVEHSLDVQTVKNLQLFLQPGIVRQDSPGEDIWQMPRVFPIGYYLVRIIIAKGPYETDEGERLILDRYTTDPLTGGLQFITEMDLIDHRKHFGEAYRKIVAPTTDEEMKSLSMEALDKRMEDFEKAREKLIDVYKERGYDAYGAPLKTANATEFSGDGCVLSDRTPCFVKDDYIAHFDTLAYSENGVLSLFAKLGFNVEHFRHLGSKNSILIGIYPTNPNLYKYQPAIQHRGNRCVLDVEHTTFKPLPTCDDKKNDGKECHQLETPWHWGLFFTTEFGMQNIVWPMKNNYDEVFGLDPLEISNKTDHELKQEQTQLKIMEAVIRNANQSSTGDYRAGFDSDVEDSYKSIVNEWDFVVSDVGVVKIDKLRQYCENVERQISEMHSDYLSEEVLPTLDVRSLDIRRFICSENMQDMQESLNGITRNKIRHQIRKYFVYNKFFEEKDKDESPMQKYLQVQTQKGSFCDERSHKATSLDEDGNDLSESFLGYQDCVCNSPNEKSITKKMAHCFAKEQGLILVQGKDFLKNLKKLGISDESLIRNPSLSQDFLKIMCTFWFDEYYKNYLKFNHIENIYNKTISHLEFLYNNPYVEIPEDKQLDVNFNHFKGISGNSSDVAQWFQNAYNYNNSEVNVGYEPFQKKKANTSHPFFKCNRDPLKFFHIERKVMVGELAVDSGETKYKSGRVYSLTTQASQGAHIRIEHSRRQQISSSLRGEFRFEPGKTASGILNFARITLGAGLGGEESRAGATSSTEQIATDSTKSVLLAVNHVQMDLALAKHKTCIVIRPKTDAFKEMLDSNWVHFKNVWYSELPSSLKQSDDVISLLRHPYTDSGLLICDDDSRELITVPENYYYIHQFFGGHAYEFMSRTIYHNRPYTEIIRGQEKMDKFVRLTQNMTYNRERIESPFGMGARIKHLSHDRGQLDRNLIKAFEQNSLDWSGFYKGIYTYPSLINYYDFETAKSQGCWGEKSQGCWDELMDSFANVLAVPEESLP